MRAHRPHGAVRIGHQEIFLQGGTLGGRRQSERDPPMDRVDRDLATLQRRLDSGLPCAQVLAADGPDVPFEGAVGQVQLQALRTNDQRGERGIGLVIGLHHDILIGTAGWCALHEARRRDRARGLIHPAEDERARVGVEACGVEEPHRLAHRVDVEARDDGRAKESDAGSRSGIVPPRGMVKRVMPVAYGGLPPASGR